ncbi:MAG: hypothetical protein ACF8XB_07720 [Planctomycetota bacterium JB042]
MPNTDLSPIDYADPADLELAPWGDAAAGAANPDGYDLDPRDFDLDPADFRGRPIGPIGPI